MKIRIFTLLFLLSLFQNSFSQINTPDTCKVPFGLISQSTPTPYPHGLMPTNLPKGKFTYMSPTLFGKSQDAYTAYVNWKKDFIEDCGSGAMRVKFDTPTQTVSEGIAYGMLLSAYAADKNVFDGLYKYYKANSNTNKVMHWKINGCSGTIGYNGATDAELDAALALIVAECQWPTATSPYEYSSEATTLINAIKAHEIHPTTYQTINGDGWTFGSLCRNPSYFAPAYYKQFALQVPADSAFWAVNVVNASYAFLAANRNSSNGLVSNWATPTGATDDCGGPPNYGYDACRNPWRMATDVLWHNDANAKDLLTKNAAWLKGTSKTCSAPIELNASSPTAGSSHNALFTSTWAAGTMGGGNANLLNEFYTETIAQTDGSYYGSTIRTLMIFMMTGNFWKPCPLGSYVEIANFNVSQKAGKVSLNFATTIELQNSHFNLYVSNDLVNFTLLEQIPGNLNSRSVLEYVFNEDRYIDHTVYYKLTFTDSEGTEKELITKSVYRDTKVEALLSPNPFEESQRVYISTPNNDPVPVKIVDMKGRTILSKSDFPVNQEYELKLELPSGTYLLMVTFEDKRYSFKMQKH